MLEMDEEYQGMLRYILFTGTDREWRTASQRGRHPQFSKKKSYQIRGKIDLDAAQVTEIQDYRILLQHGM
ncbi:hypothetical protein J5N97_003480 [Dioscorea zingiberensis]|uniref:Uncharacterized protein n=1 Tax=Dioscorea zingiberensis TaxID=325984 RepID=A0A9D5D5L3_9LILI|nr:hypothetical protein J5N97_003480 [Dioscorea zingiberensis]